MANKVRFGLKNVHYSIITEGVDGALTYETPVKWPGAVNLSLEAQGDPAEFYADNGTYFTVPVNNGYDGELEMAEIPDEFRQEVLGEIVNNGVSFEDGDTKNYKKFALLYEFDGDSRATRHVNYYCSASRPTEEGGTTTDTIEPNTTTLNFQARKRPDNGLVKARCTTDAPQDVYDNWYAFVFEKPADVQSTGVTVSPSSATIDTGSTLQLTATVQPSNASIKSVSYETSDESIATVDSTGKVIAVAAGTATITVTPVGGGSIDTCTLTVA